MAEEGEEWKEEPEVWQSNRLGERSWPREWETNHLAILNEEHEVIPVRSIHEWGSWVENVGNRRVAETTVNGFWVSTVFLGINHDYSGAGPGLWFETMVFDDKEGGPPPPEIGAKVRRFLSDMQVRYPTWAEAEKGHATIVEIIRCGLF